MNLIDIISAGPGDLSLLTQAARQALLAAKHVFGAERYRALAGDKAVFYSVTPLGAALDKIEALYDQGQRAAVIVSGDAGLYSMLGVLKKRFGAQALNVIPGISSLQYLCARLGTPWQDARVLSAHGRDLSPAALCFAARTNAHVFVLLDGERDPAWVKGALDEGGLGALKLCIGERLSYPDEHIAPYEERAYDALSCALIENDAPVPYAPSFGLDDECFIRGNTPMTKREIRAQILSALRLTPGAVCWDIGAGTGSVSVEMALCCPLGSVYAIEREGEAQELIQQNARHFGLMNLSLVRGEAPGALSDLPAPTHVFLGGTGRETEAIIALLKGLNAPIRLCATAVTLETEQTLFELLSLLPGFSAVQLYASRLEKLGSYHMRRAQNPVTVFAADVGGNA